MAGHVAGDPLQCYGIPLVLHKEPDVNELGQQVFDADGRPRYRCGFRIGGGIDQEPLLSPQGYPDKGIYVTYIYDRSPAQYAGLQVHDKLLQVNGHDLTMTTHKKAVEYIGRKPVLNLLVYRKGMPQLQQRQPPAAPSAYRERGDPVYQHQQQQFAQQSSPSYGPPYYRQS
jgi:hypothetical protein